MSIYDTLNEKQKEAVLQTEAACPDPCRCGKR